MTEKTKQHRERPIIFSAPMIQAILGGTKTQTRRILKPQPTQITSAGKHSQYKWRELLVALEMYPSSSNILAHLPIRSGDLLWMRETCRAEELSDGIDGVRYLADGTWVSIENSPEAAAKWVDLFHYRGRGKGMLGNNVPSIHQPRWASRIALLVTDVRVERLKDISEEDAQAEGISPQVEPPVMRGLSQAFNMRHLPYGSAFANLWDQINGHGAWDINPWVYAVSFEPAKV